MKRKKTLLIIGGAIVLLLIIKVMVGGSTREAEQSRVAVEPVTRGTLTEIVDASGSIQPEVKVTISSDVSGEIIELLVREGDPVKEGQLLCKIDPDLVEANLSRQEAALNSARANLANARARAAQTKAQFIATEQSYNRTKKLHDQGAISQQEYENAVSSYEMGKADVLAATESVNASSYNVKSAEASVSEARENVGRTSLYSPMDGTVSMLSAEKGERVVGSEMTQGTVIMQIADLEVMEAKVDVNESLIPRVQEGDTAFIEVDAYLGRKFMGVVTEISQSPNTTGSNVDQVTNYPVKIRLLRTSYEDLIEADRPYLSPIRPGMSASVEIHTETANNVLQVPIEAVTTRNDTAAKDGISRFDLTTDDDEEELEDMECVFVVNNGVAHLRLVETGIQDSYNMEIKSGLEEGDEVVVSPYEMVSRKLFNRDKVTVSDKSDLFTED